MKKNKKIEDLLDRWEEGNMSVKDLQDELYLLYDVSKRNWFERLPLHWRYIYYLVGGIIVGLLLPYVC